MHSYCLINRIDLFKSREASKFPKPNLFFSSRQIEAHISDVCHIRILVYSPVILAELCDLHSCIYVLIKISMFERGCIVA